MAHWRVGLVAVLLLAAAGISGVLLLQHHDEPGVAGAVAQACGAGADSGCHVVARSSWSKLAGVPLAAWGLAFYASLAFAALLALVAGPSTRALLMLVVGGGLAAALALDLALLGVQALAIGAFCTLCLATYVVGAAALAASWPAWTQRATARAAGGEGRLALAGWALATVALATAVTAGESVLNLREADRQANLLGPAPGSTTLPVTGTHPPGEPSPAAEAPSPAADPVAGASASAAAPEQALSAARAEVARLQGILDDPRQLEQYFTSKALHEFEVEKPQAISLEGVPVKGPADAAVQVLEFSDFLCPYCRQVATAFSNFLPRSQGRVAIYYKNFPLEKSCNPKLTRDVHPGACALALGGICAQQQGRFWPYHDKVFSETLKDPTPADVARLAGTVGLDAGQIERCIGSDETRRRLAAEVAEGEALGIAGTPSVFINRKKVGRIGDFLLLVDQELARQGLPTLSASQAGAGHGHAH